MSACPTCGHRVFAGYAELNSLRAQVGQAGAPRHTGISSDALVEYAFGFTGRPADNTFKFPVDRDDLGACRRTVAMARRLHVDPEVQERMDELLADYTAHVGKRYPQPS